ncbi:MAG TPA: hypothetical protein VE954_43310 [Oligoflexus sp.]|uniref:hypothetical protein n=1 Tax=Oligoflexus sp. TaxID=1971216 RepID=UPI002D4968BB|nr:hypothetical protein [Oligoflexus sp.]HYX39974.1 hypothetical protein [Oligoflexus sp.]
MNSLERLKELAQEFDRDEGGIGFLEICDVMDGLKKLLDVVEATDELCRNFSMVTTNYDNPDGSPPVLLKYTTSRPEDVKRVMLLLNELGYRHQVSNMRTLQALDE